LAEGGGWWGGLGGGTVWLGRAIGSSMGGVGSWANNIGQVIRMLERLSCLTRGGYSKEEIQGILGTWNDAMDSIYEQELGKLSGMDRNEAVQQCVNLGILTKREGRRAPIGGASTDPPTVITHPGVEDPVSDEPDPVSRPPDPGGRRVNVPNVLKRLLDFYGIWQSWQRPAPQANGWSLYRPLPYPAAAAPPQTGGTRDMPYINTSIIGEPGGWAGVLQSGVNLAGQLLGGGGRNQAYPGGAPISAGFMPSLNFGIPGYDLMGETRASGCNALTSPFAAGGSRGARAKTHVQMDPISGRPVWFKPAGRPLLWSGDLTAVKRVRKIASRARRARGGR
jgi:hypothetical protein